MMGRSSRWRRCRGGSSLIETVAVIGGVAVVLLTVAQLFQRAGDVQRETVRAMTRTRTTAILVDRLRTDAARAERVLGDATELRLEGGDTGESVVYRIVDGAIERRVLRGTETVGLDTTPLEHASRWEWSLTEVAGSPRTFPLLKVALVEREPSDAGRAPLRIAARVGVEQALHKSAAEERR
jgi:hypothetical protein